MKRLVGTLVVTVFAVLAAGCDTVATPASDSTPPSLSWHVEDLTDATSTTFEGGGTVTAKKGDDFRVTLTAKDAEGVHEITLGGGYTKRCVSGSTAQDSNGLFGDLAQTLAPDPDGTVLTSIVLVNTYNPVVSCQSGFTWAYTAISLNGAGANYFGGTTKGIVAINVRP